MERTQKQIRDGNSNYIYYSNSHKCFELRAAEKGEFKGDSYKYVGKHVSPLIYNLFIEYLEDYKPSNLKQAKFLWCAFQKAIILILNKKAEFMIDGKIFNQQSVITELDWDYDNNTWQYYV